MSKPFAQAGEFDKDASKEAPDAPQIDIDLATVAEEDATPPPAVLWSAQLGSVKAPLLSEGEVALFGGPGGLGKSSIALEIGASSRKGGACGIGIRPGKTVYVSYEDSMPRLAARLKWSGSPPSPDALAWRNPKPLFRYDVDEPKSAEWAPFWKAVRAVPDVSLVVIDPASVALLGVDVSDSGAVRDFIDALTEEAQAAKVGVLLVAHDTKQARNEARAGLNPGAGAIAGSAAWHDGARGALYLWRYLRDGEDLVIECVKSNYGPTGWGALLTPRGGKEWKGYEFAASLTREGVASAREEMRNESRPDAKGQSYGRVCYVCDAEFWTPKPTEDACGDCRDLTKTERKARRKEANDAKEVDLPEDFDAGAAQVPTRTVKPDEELPFDSMSPEEEAELRSPERLEELGKSTLAARRVRSIKDDVEAVDMDIYDYSEDLRRRGADPKSRLMLRKEDAAEAEDRLRKMREEVEEAGGPWTDEDSRMALKYLRQLIIRKRRAADLWGRIEAIPGAVHDGKSPLKVVNRP